jgi:hypothetical protein
VKKLNGKIRRLGSTLAIVICLSVLACTTKNNPSVTAKECEQRISKKIDVVVLQAWATNLLIQYPVGRTNYAGPFQVPEYLTSVCPGRKPSVYIQGGYYGEESYVRVFWGGGGIGHWGLEIGTPTFIPRRSEETITEWKPGVCFFEDFR